MTSTENTDEPVLPVWLRDLDEFRAVARFHARRTAYRVRKFAWSAPRRLALLCLYVPRGLARVVAVLARYLYDYDSAQVRHHHAGNVETSEYARAQQVRKANLRARWMVAATVAVVVLGPVLAWTFPRVLSGIAGAWLCYTIVKLIPGRSLTELIVGAAVGLATWWWGPLVLALIPRPPAWAAVPVAALVVGWLGWHGRPAGASGLSSGSRYDEPSALEKPSAEMVVDAIIASVPGVTDKQRDLFRVHQPGVGRGKHGWYLSLELPPGSTVSDLMEQREAFAAAMRRQLGCVWPSRGNLHPGHLKLFIGDEPMATAEQPPWKLADGKPVDVFDKLPLFTDQEGRWFEQRLAYNAVVIGGAPGYGKSFALRELGVAVAFDLRVKVKCYDGKGNGDLRPLRLVADEFHEGDEPEDIRTQLASVQAVREEMRRRARFLRDLPAEENPEDKVTSALVDRYRHLAPIVLLFDEVQVYTEHEDKAIREAFIAAMADLVRRGRSAGIIPVFCTQKPSATVIPTIIVDNCSVRLCFRVNGQKANDAVLGTEMHTAGIKATKFGADDKGLAWLKGDGSEPLVVRTVHGLDKPASELLMRKARALREARGLLTGYAAGNESAAEDEQVRLLDDCRAVLDGAGMDRMHLSTLLDRLALLRSGIYGPMDAEALGRSLRGAGVATGQVKIGDKNTTGIRRAALDIAATSDENPDDDGPDDDGVVVPLR